VGSVFARSALVGLGDAGRKKWRIYFRWWRI